MKKLLLLCLAVAAGYSVSAQQNGKTAYMSITVFQYNNRIDNMIVTRTDSAQVNHALKIKLGNLATAKAIAAEDDILMGLVTPYFKSGWKLISFAEMQYSEMTYVTHKYFLSRDE